MLLIGLLVLAFVCLALGLVLASAAWLVGSLAASAAAAVVLWMARDRIARKTRTPAADSPTRTPVGQASPAAQELPAAALTPAGGVAHEPAASDTAAAGPVSPGVDPARLAERAAWFAEGTAPGEVWVIDGQPHYHRADCGQLTGSGAETVPSAQAVEDGFAACPICRPEEDSGAGRVWVLDGRPRYHRQDCPIVSGQDAEPVPLEQATEDGFMACSLCQPDVTGG